MDAAPAEGPAQIPLADEDDMHVAVRRLLAVTRASFEQRSQLEQALQTRIVIEQAKGVLAERLRLTVDEAFDLLRGSARSGRRRIHDLAREVVEERETPAELRAALPGFRDRRNRTNA